MPEHDPIGHLEVVANADAYLVAPASANTVAKLAAGIADSMVTTSFLACAAPRLVAPAMNDRMYRDAATQANLATLRQRGITVIEPEEGALASRGEHGVGRLPEPRALLDAIEQAAPGPIGPWDGLRVLVSAGGTREPIDPVRFIGNRSSGRMGLALAERAARRGAEVTLVAANVSLPAPPGVTAGRCRDRGRAGRRPGPEFDSTDVLVMAAAPADFRPRRAAGEKIHREGTAASSSTWRRPRTSSPRSAPAAARDRRSSGSPPRPTPDLVARPEKLERKGADAIVLNDVSRSEIGFESAENEVVIVERCRGASCAARLEGGGGRRDPRPGRRAAVRVGRRAGRAAELALPPALLARPLTLGSWPRTASRAESLYSLYRRGMELLEDGDFEEATVPLKEAARQAPEKSSVREALGRALFRTRHYAEAATEFEAVVETHPVNDYAHFCLGRALSKTGETRRARHHLALASNLRPERRDYRIYRERLAAPASSGDAMTEIRLLAVPYEVGALRMGVGRGPERLLEAGAEEALASHGAKVSLEIDRAPGGPQRSKRCQRGQGRPSS